MRPRSWELAVYDFCAGTDTRAYEWLGVHRIGAQAYVFRLFAPQAQGVTLCGDFLPDGAYPMAKKTAEGVWEVTVRAEIPTEGMRYAFRAAGEVGAVCDPFAQQCMTEAQSGTESIICTGSSFEWQDFAWMSARTSKQADGPINLYHLHLSSFATHHDQSCISADGYLNYRELGEILARYVWDMGYTHIRMMPLCEHTREALHGYLPDALFAPTCRHGTPDDLRAMIDCLHRAGIGVVMDLPLGQSTIPFPFAAENGVLDMSHPAVQSLILSAALFWLREYHLDGLYPVGSITWPKDFLHRFCATVHAAVPGALLIGERMDECREERWDMMMQTRFCSDVPSAIGVDGERWKSVRDRLTLGMREAVEFDQPVLLSLHPPVMSGKSRDAVMVRIVGEYQRRFDAARLALSYLMAHPGGKQLFMGSELGQSRPWDGSVPPDWFLRELPVHAALAEYVRTLNLFYRQEPRLWMGAQAQLRELAPTVLLLGRGEQAVRTLWILLNFGDTAQTLSLPTQRGFRILLDSDRPMFGGLGRIGERAESAQGSAEIYLPPLCAVFFEEADRDESPARSFVLHSVSNESEKRNI